MSRAALAASVHKYIGCPVTICIDGIEEAAARNRYSVLILDPVFNPASIDADESRLNVRTDKDGVVVSFSIG